jgi:predicted metal-binding membrane protein
MTATPQSAPVAASARRPGRYLLAGGVIAAAAGAWLVLTVTHPGGHHHTVAMGPALTGWLIMIIAMMLPTALPLLELVRRLVPGRAAIVALVAAIYVAVWTVAGVVLVAGTVHASTRLAAVRSQTLLGAALILAGAWQFSAVKDRCLTVCRTPRGIAMTRWRGTRPAWVEASAIAGVYAASCVGCCWALMAVGLVTGAASLVAMALLTAVMATERLTRHGRILVRPAGAAALILGACFLLGVDKVFAG